MTSFFVVPTFAPPTLEQLPAEPDDVSLIVKQEAKITQEVLMGRALDAWPTAPCRSRPSPLTPSLVQLAEVREYHREAVPLGVIAAQEELESEQDEALTSDEGGWPRRACCLLAPAACAPACLRSGCMESATAQLQRSATACAPRPMPARRQPLLRRRQPTDGCLRRSLSASLLLPGRFDRGRGGRGRN